VPSGLKTRLKLHTYILSIVCGRIVTSSAARYAFPVPDYRNKTNKSRKPRGPFALSNRPFFMALGFTWYQPAVVALSNSHSSFWNIFERNTHVKYRVGPRGR
jgi:hypothetical protein